MRRYIAILTALAALLTGTPAAAGLVVIANPDSGVKQLTHDDVINIFMGRYQKLPSGVIALPIDLADEKAEFYGALVGKTLAEINSYWARLVFSGRASPPHQMTTSAEILETVRNNRGAIGYLDDSLVNSHVRIVYRFPATPR